MSGEWLIPDWHADARVGARVTTRAGGVSAPPWDSMNLGLGSGDARESVLANRERLAAAIGATPVFMRQVHGARVIRVDADSARADAQEADASWTDMPGVACTVLVSDCLPVLLAAPRARAVGAAHAGWRGLSAGVVEACARAVCSAAACAPHELAAWLGPCIGRDAFEVGADVLVAFGIAPAAGDRPRFRYAPRADGDARWRADLAGLARDRLAALGVTRVSGGTWCTVQDRSRFFSFRRDGVTGRMAAAVWIAR
ncbi:MAG TPA: peptidoglycan editing factor PgeF [Burkholderiaceae bacterium]|nr:peptidoglycan editing factor PgeF [Burkholderiaceae bacterium]